VTVVTDRDGHHAHTATHAGTVPEATEDSTMFKTNVGGIDRILRIVAGLALIALTLTGTIGVWGWIGVVPLATGLMSSCPLYSIIGLNTCPMKS
jgi:Protein of unknown function (DUF2892)